MRHQHRDTPSADLHVENMELTQCHVGSAAPFWELPFDLYGCLAPRSWMKSTWEHLDKTPLTLKGPKFTVSPKRARDDHLMDIFVQHDFDVETLRILNECRLCLHITTVADITEADGSAITQEAWEGKRTQRCSHNWPKTTSLSADEWQTWREALCRTILFQHQQDKQLQQALGCWATAQDDEWLWWFDASQDAIYEKQPHRANRKWIRSNPNQVSRRYHIEHTLDEVTIPLNCRWCSARKTIGQDRLRLLSSDQSHLYDNVEEAATPVAFHQYLESLPQDARWAISRSRCADGGASVARAFRAGTLQAVGDGSLKIRIWHICLCA